DWVGILLPRKPDVDTETFLRRRAFVTSLHDARPRTGDHHPARIDDFTSERHRLLVLDLVWLGARGTKDRQAPHLRVRREEPERVTQLTQRGTDQIGVPAILNII